MKDGKAVAKVSTVVSSQSAIGSIYVPDLKGIQGSKSSRFKIHTAASTAFTEFFQFKVRDWAGYGEKLGGVG